MGRHNEFCGCFKVFLQEGYPYLVCADGARPKALEAVIIYEAVLLEGLDSSTDEGLVSVNLAYCNVEPIAVEVAEAEAVVHVRKVADEDVWHRPVERSEPAGFDFEEGHLLGCYPTLVLVPCDADVVGADAELLADHLDCGASVQVYKKKKYIVT